MNNFYWDWLGFEPGFPRPVVLLSWCVYNVLPVCAQTRLRYVHEFLLQGLMPFFHSGLLSFSATGRHHPPTRKVGTPSPPPPPHLIKLHGSSWCHRGVVQMSSTVKKHIHRRLSRYKQLGGWVPAYKLGIPLRYKALEPLFILLCKIRRQFVSFSSRWKMLLLKVTDCLGLMKMYVFCMAISETWF